MNKEEYYKRIEKINNRFKTDRVGADKEYQLVCERNYLSTKYIEQLQEENKKLKDNWNKLKEYIQKDYDFFGKLIDPEYGCAMGALSRVKDKMQELEGSDSNEY